MSLSQRVGIIKMLSHCFLFFIWAVSFKHSQIQGDTKKNKNKIEPVVKPIMVCGGVGKHDARVGQRLQYLCFWHVDVRVMNNSAACCTTGTF